MWAVAGKTAAWLECLHSTWVACCAFFFLFVVLGLNPGPVRSRQALYQLSCIPPLLCILLQPISPILQ